MSKHRKGHVPKTVSESTSFLASIVDSSDDAIISKTLDGIINSWNMGATKLYGYTEKEALGNPMSILIPPESPDETPNFLNKIKQGEHIEHFETIRKRKDGTLINVSLTISPINGEDGKIIGASIIARDITRYRQTEEALRLANAYNRSLIEASLDPLVTISLDGVITDVNKATEAVTGYSREGLIGTDFSIYFTDPGKAKEGYLEVFRKGSVTDYPLEIRHREGHITPVIYNASIYKDEAGNVIGIFAAARDITKLKNAEEALQKKIIEVQRSNAELEQFAYVASHDLQEPLRMVASYVNLLDRRYKDQLDSDAKEFIGFAMEGATRMQQAINDLLTYSRVDSRGRPFEPDDLERVLERVLKILRIAIQENDAVVTHTPLPIVMADDLQMIQLFQNLIGNAIKFQGDKPPTVQVTAEKRGSEWLFSVKDNGIGIEPQYYDRIFIIFNRLHTRAEYPGSGIGLAVCKKIVERHGGRIWVESTPGEGSTFYFTIPIKTVV